jgi:tRNA nucleotidyltransferase/poly(A) polymerase
MQVRAMLGRKIARERIGVELAGCIEGPNPALAFSLVLELDIFYEVFRVPDDYETSLVGNHGQTCVETVHRALDLLDALDFPVRCNDQAAPGSTLHHASRCTLLQLRAMTAQCVHCSALYAWPLASNCH